MREELLPIQDAVENSTLPLDPAAILDAIWDGERFRFHAQETVLLDYKETIPRQFTDEYGIGICRLCLAFHNTFGGIIVFGVKDKALTLSGIDRALDVEALNRVLAEFSAFNSECLYKSYPLETSDGEREFALLLIQKRLNKAPVRLNRPLGKYPIGTLWVRDRAEVLEARIRHLPTLYSSRSSLDPERHERKQDRVHRSLPPSPSTLKTFIGRENLLVSLWDWLIFEDQPRLYLHGPGGSGKSTIAFEFARHLVDTVQPITFKAGGALDYVIYISGKETELNPLTGRIQPFLLNQFTNAKEQFAQIAFHSGLLDQSLLEHADSDQALRLLDELFSAFNGLIVIDDIDTLQRRKIDTGEETLLMKALLNHGRTRILYTLRFPPPNAQTSARGVPGLNDQECYDFIEACSKQFGVKAPDGQYLPLILQSTKSLPLLIETIVGLRRYCSNYRDALDTFVAKGGEESRRYLYQREYDRLDKDGKSRQLLAGLGLLGEAVSFSTLCNLFQFSNEQLRDAIDECSSVFLSATDDLSSGDTLYQLTPPSIPFANAISKEIPYFVSLQKTVQHFTKTTGGNTPTEAALIVRLDGLIRKKRFQEVAALIGSLPGDDPVLINPRVRALAGQGYAELGPEYRERAREAFKAASGLKYRDIFMMRCWFNLEFASGYGYLEAERICNLMLADSQLNARYRSEFLSKKGICLFQQGTALIHVSRDKAVVFLKQSMGAYFEALWVGAPSPDIDPNLTLSWLERPIDKFMQLAVGNIEEIFIFLESLVDAKHDVHQEGAETYLKYLLRAPIPADRKDIQNRLKGLCTRTIKKINSSVKLLNNHPGFSTIVETLEDIRTRVEKVERRQEEAR